MLSQYDDRLYKCFYHYHQASRDRESGGICGSFDFISSVSLSTCSMARRRLDRAHALMTRSNEALSGWTLPLMPLEHWSCIQRKTDSARCGATPSRLSAQTRSTELQTRVVGQGQRLVMESSNRSCMRHSTASASSPE